MASKTVAALIVVAAVVAAAAGGYFFFTPADEHDSAPLPRAEETGETRETGVIDRVAEEETSADLESRAEPEAREETAARPDPEPAREPEPRVDRDDEAVVARVPAAEHVADEDVADQDLADEGLADAADPQDTSRPSFDIVRVERTGEALIAGRGAPDSEITVLEAGEPIATGRTDGRGEFVLLPERPFAPGQRQLTLRTRDREGREAESDDVVVLTVPERVSPPLVEDETADDPVPDQDLEVAALPEAVEEDETALEVTPEEAREERASTEPEEDESLPTVVLVPRESDGEVRVLQRSGPEAGIQAAGLRLETIRYTVDGRVDIRGHAEAGYRVVVLLNGEVIGETVVGDDGTWRIVPEGNIAPGLHTLRVEQRGADDDLVAHVETPFSSQPMITAADDEDFIIIQPGHTLWTIAERTYEAGWRYNVIYEANIDQIENPDLIYPGQVFVLPGRETGG